MLTFIIIMMIIFFIFFQILLLKILDIHTIYFIIKIQDPSMKNIKLIGDNEINNRRKENGGSHAAS